MLFIRDIKNIRLHEEVNKKMKKFYHTNNKQRKLV